MRILTLMTLTMMAGCRPALPPARSSTDSQTSTDSQASIAAPDAAPGRSLSPSLCGDLAENGLRIPTTRRNAVRAQLGRPDSARSQPTPNRHNPAQTDSVVDVFYPGLRLHYYVLGVAEGETDLLLEADVSDNRYLKYPALGVGASVGAIVSALGQPEGRTNDTYSYSCALHVMEGSTVYFHFKGDRVKFVEYSFYAD